MTLDELNGIEISGEQFEKLSKYEGFLEKASRHGFIPNRVTSELQVIYDDIIGVKTKRNGCCPSSAFIRMMNRWYVKYRAQQEINEEEPMVDEPVVEETIIKMNIPIESDANDEDIPANDEKSEEPGVEEEVVNVEEPGVEIVLDAHYEEVKIENQPKKKGRKPKSAKVVNVEEEKPEEQ